jgi:hypothetical protein
MLLRIIIIQNFVARSDIGVFHGVRRLSGTINLPSYERVFSMKTARLKAGRE